MFNFGWIWLYLYCGQLEVFMGFTLSEPKLKENRKRSRKSIWNICSLPLKSCTIYQIIPTSSSWLCYLLGVTEVGYSYVKGCVVPRRLLLLCYEESSSLKQESGQTRKGTLVLAALCYQELYTSSSCKDVYGDCNKVPFCTCVCLTSFFLPTQLVTQCNGTIPSVTSGHIFSMKRLMLSLNKVSRSQSLSRKNFGTGWYSHTSMN